MIKVTDFIVEYLISKGVKDVFGYPGGVICHFIDSLSKYSEIKNHISYHEQAAAFAACGYAQENCSVGVAYSTSGPGATNLITGIANAFYDYTPVLFFTGQVDTYALRGSVPVRQRGFQETNIVDLVSDITKLAIRVDNPDDIGKILNKAFDIATTGSPGPVLIDLPADVQRAMIDAESFLPEEKNKKDDLSSVKENAIRILDAIKNSEKPCFLFGNGIKQCGLKDMANSLIRFVGIPVVFSMPAFDTLSYDDEYNYGFIGANGERYGNFVLGKSDLIVTLGSRLDSKQVGYKRELFVPDTQIIRVDIDEGNLEYGIHPGDVTYVEDLKEMVPELLSASPKYEFDFEEWNKKCSSIRSRLRGYDYGRCEELIGGLARRIPDNVSVTVDVGQSQVWTVRQLRIKKNQSVHMSCGLGSMGFSLPAAIGTYYASNLPVISFNGDGGIQMNIQELETLSRDNLPITVVIINNRCLGMIRGFQKANFGSKFEQTIEGNGYSTPNFEKIANAYGLRYKKIGCKDDLEQYVFNNRYPNVVEIVVEEDCELKPNFGTNGVIQDQRPFLDRDLYDELMSL